MRKSLNKILFTVVILVLGIILHFWIKLDRELFYLINNLHTPWLDKFLIKMDGIMGYGKQHKENKWWFDLEEVDGILQIPQKKQ